ncbi:MAG: exodeoxyribonuclease VII small subunit [Candidatus Electronema sp. VV]
MSKKTFEQALAKLEQGQSSLDLSLKKFDEGLPPSAARSWLRPAAGLNEDGGLAAVPFSAADEV